MTSFDLRYEPWIVVRESGGSVREVGLVEAFDRAHEIRALAGELATQEAAILRMLLAVLYRALPRPPSIEDARDRWGEWWKAPELPVGQIREYLVEHADRFDLLHPEAPFLQVVDLSASKTSGLGKLIADVPDGHAYFTTRAGRELTSLSLAEAARWLVHLHAFDPSGIKTGASEDARVKGGRGYPIGTGWAGACGLLIVQGSTLKETLLLNLALNVPSSESDRPVWERPPLNGAEEDSRHRPSGPADLFTWPIRRARLFVEDRRVVDVLITNGDPIASQNRHQIEPMSAWRRSQAQEKKHGLATVYMPRQHDPSRSVWRGLGGLLAGVGEWSRASTGGDDALAPRSLDWLADLRHHGCLSGAELISIRAVGMSYGSNNSVVDAVVDDALRLHVVVVSDPPAFGCAKAAVVDAEAAVQALRRLAENLARASGTDTEGAKDRAGELGYSLLDAGYRRWLGSLDEASDLTERPTTWQRHVNAVISRAGQDLVSAAGTSAWIGREVTVNGKTTVVDSSLAHLWFLGRLRKTLDRIRGTRRDGADGAMSNAIEMEDVS